MPLLLMIVPLFRSIYIASVCGCVFVCVGHERNSREHFVYRINIDTNQARVQLICMSVTGSSAGFHAVWLWRWMPLFWTWSPAKWRAVETKPDNLLLLRTPGCFVDVLVPELAPSLPERENRSWASGCRKKTKEAKEEVQGRPRKANVWQEELQKTCKQEGIILTLKWIRVALSRGCCSTRSSHKPPRW